MKPRHYKVICKERGIDLAAQSEQTVPQQEAASEAEVPMQAPARHAYKLHSNFERTSPADSTYIQEYTVADDLSIIPAGRQSIKIQSLKRRTQHMQAYDVIVIGAAE